MSSDEILDGPIIRQLDLPVTKVHMRRFLDAISELSKMKVATNTENRHIGSNVPNLELTKDQESKGE